MQPAIDMVAAPAMFILMGVAARAAVMATGCSVIRFAFKIIGMAERMTLFAMSDFTIIRRVVAAPDHSRAASALL